MKRMTRIFFCYMLIAAANSGFAQEPCTVLLPAIADNYNGSCRRGMAHGEGFAWGSDQYYGNFRNGLPHGSGKYTWANGDIYEGQWRDGKRHGNGTLKFEKDGEHVVLSGVWENDEFIRSERTAPYTPGHILNVERYNIRRTGDGNMILLTTYEQGRVNSNPQNLNFRLDTGSSILVGQSSGYDGVSFPADVKITYTVADKLQQGAVVRVRFEVIINEPGTWEIRIYN